MNIKAIETRYAGHRFRSRLEARWAVFFDAYDIPWEYEPQGFVIPLENGESMPYLPDFLLPECGTWIEVKGNDGDIDRQLLLAAARHLPGKGIGEYGPRLMILGPIPTPRSGDWGWIGLTPFTEPGGATEIGDSWWGFGGYVKSGRPWTLTETSSATPVSAGTGSWVQPDHDGSIPYCPIAAYEAARSARFEHGERG